MGEGGPQAYRVNRVSGPVPRRRKSVRARFLEAAYRAGPRRAVCREVLCQAIEKAAVTGAAAPAVPVTDTVKRAEDGLAAETVNRAGLWAVQTPQVFEAGLIRAALEKALADGEVECPECGSRYALDLSDDDEEDGESEEDEKE